MSDKPLYTKYDLWVMATRVLGYKRPGDRAREYGKTLEGVRGYCYGRFTSPEIEKKVEADIARAERMFEGFNSSIETEKV